MYNTISLFSGAMGLDLGLEHSGFEALVCAENDKACVQTIKLNRPHLPVLHDITRLSGKEILRAAALKVGDVDAVVGGPPCQAFSTAGRRLSTQDPRGNLVYEFVRIVSETKPRFFVMENVKGLVSAALVHKPLKDRNGGAIREDEQLGSAFRQIMHDFQRIGYKIIWGVLDAVNYGVPQFRERLIIVGSRDGEDIFIPCPTHFMRHQDPAYRWATLGQAIIDLEDEPGPCGRFSSERAKYLVKIRPGENWRALPKNDIPKALGGAFQASGGKMGFYRRLSYNEPCPTLVTSPVQKATSLCHPAKTRPLSTLEYARIQGFPQSWEFHGSMADVYRQLGNAVPVGLGKAIGQMLNAVMNQQHIIVTKRKRGVSADAGAVREASCYL
jgi:DNA (cytosine-5)-methyltransferase 1